MELRDVETKKDIEEDLIGKLFQRRSERHRSLFSDRTVGAGARCQGLLMVNVKLARDKLTNAAIAVGLRISPPINVIVLFNVATVCAPLATAEPRSDADGDARGVE